MLRRLVLLSLLLLGSAGSAFALPGAGPDSILDVFDVETGAARLGENPFRATVRNRSDSALLVVVDLRTEPGLWMGSNIQRQTGVEVPAGSTRRIEGWYLFPVMSDEARLRVRIGPGERIRVGEWDLLRVTAVAFERWYEVGAESPDALDPEERFTVLREGPLELYAWKGSPADERLGTIARERLDALEAIAGIVGVEPPEVRIVFYGDAETKVAHTGHTGLGRARGRTVVEVFGREERLDRYHELVHVVAGTTGSPPPLLSEGLAVHLAERLGGDALRPFGGSGRSADEVVCGVRRERRLVPVDSLLGYGNIPSGPDRSAVEYAEAGSFVRFLAVRGGMERFRSAYARLDEGVSAGENARRLRELYGEDLRSLEARWLEDVERACR